MQNRPLTNSLQVLWDIFNFRNYQILNFPTDSQSQQNKQAYSWTFSHMIYINPLSDLKASTLRFEIVNPSSVPNEWQVNCICIVLVTSRDRIFPLSCKYRWFTDDNKRLWRSLYINWILRENEVLWMPVTKSLNKTLHTEDLHIPDVRAFPIPNAPSKTFSRESWERSQE